MLVPHADFVEGPQPLVEGPQPLVEGPQPMEGLCFSWASLFMYLFFVYVS